MDVERKLARELAQARERRVGVFFDDDIEQLRALGRQDVGHLRCLHVVGAGRLGFADQARGLIDIGARRQPRAHLDHRGLEGAVAHARASLAEVA